MTPLEEMIAFNELMKNLIKHEDVSAKISDIQYFKDVLKELQRQDGIEVQLVIPTKDGNVNFNDLFGDTDTEEKKSEEEIRKEIKEKVQEVIATKEKEKADDEYTISLSFGRNSLAIWTAASRYPPVLSRRSMTRFEKLSCCSCAREARNSS